MDSKLQKPDDSYENAFDLMTELSFWGLGKKKTFLITMQQWHNIYCLLHLV